MLIAGRTSTVVSPASVGVARGARASDEVHRKMASQHSDDGRSGDERPAATEISSRRRERNLERVLAFPLVEALATRRSRRFGRGAVIPDGAFAYRSQEAPLPLDDLERALVLTSMAGNTGWQYLHPHSTRAAPALPAYSLRAGGRTVPSGAGWSTVELFFTDDTGTYVFETRDAPSLVSSDASGRIDPKEWLAAHDSRVRQLSSTRLEIPREKYISPHNRWAANLAGSLLVIPIADLAQLMLASLSLVVERGARVYDDIHHQPFPELDAFEDVLDLGETWPLSSVEQEGLAFAAAEQAMACQNGMLVLQTMGLGSWIFSGMDQLAVLGASGDPSAPGLGFRFDRDERWAVPNVTGLPGVFEGSCPPRYTTMADAVDALDARRFGPGGPFNEATPGPWRQSRRVRGSSVHHDARFRACLSTMAQAIFDRFGKFPGTVPSILITVYLQAHHLDLGFYDAHFGPGAYTETHAGHAREWHGEPD
jgi:hypothetical protein